MDGFTEMSLGGFTDAETADLIHGGGTGSIVGNAPDDSHSISGTSFTIDPTSGDMALRRYDIQLTAGAVPEPAAAILSLLGSVFLLRRRR